jgi:uncharacterized phage-associated protein
MNTIDLNVLENAIVFFAKNMKACGKIKLFKLLYLFDFEHFKQTGTSVTGLNYEAWQFGPVPKELHDAWGELRAGKSNAVEIVDEPLIDFVRETVKVRAGVEFDKGEFTPRQIKIFEMLREKHMSNMSQKMVDITHEQNEPWDKVWNGGKGAHRPIPYELAIPEDAPNRSLILESALEARRISPHMEEGGY